MNNHRPSMFVPALIGGGLAGILSGVPFISCLCCLWIIGGAMVSAYLLSKDSHVQLRVGDGAIVGIFAGIVAAIVEFIVSIPFRQMESELVRSMMEKFYEYSEEIPPGLESFLEGGDFTTSMAVSLFGLFITAVIFAVLGALGGILGISLFGKKPGQKVRTQGVNVALEDTSDRQP